MVEIKFSVQVASARDKWLKLSADETLETVLEFLRSKYAEEGNNNRRLGNLAAQTWIIRRKLAAEAPVEEAPVEEAPVEEVADETVHEVVEQVIEEETVELKKESSLAFIMGVATVAIFTYFFAFSIPKNQSADLVAESLNNEIIVSQEVLKGAEVYNQLNCQSCHTQNVRLLIPDSQNGKVLKNKFANEIIIKNTGLLRLGPDLSTSATREPTNNSKWLARYLTDSASVRDEIPHPNYDFLSATDLDYLLTYLLSLGEVNE